MTLQDTRLELMSPEAKQGTETTYSTNVGIGFLRSVQTK